MKKIGVLIPTFNEEENVELAYKSVTSVMTGALSRYEYEIVFIDNDSTDKTRQLIRGLCEKDKHVKAIFNARNFGYSKSQFYGLINVDADAVMLIHADLQNPPELIPQFVEKWEKGAKVIIGIKKTSTENSGLWLLRSCYYKLIKKISDVEQIEHFTDYELLDRSFLDVLRGIQDPVPYLRGIVCELGFSVEKVYYDQKKRERGKSYADFFKMYDFAMLGITSYSKSLLRIPTFIGGGIFALSFCWLLVQIILHICRVVPFGFSDYLISVLLIFSGMQMCFLGFLGEYVLNINAKTTKRPLVVEQTRINF